MQVSRTVIFILFFINMNTIYSQNIKSHRWENRLLLILTDKTNSSIYKNQIKELKGHTKGLKERKLIVYQIKKDSYKTGLIENGVWQKSTDLYKTYKKSNTPFEILLIGLDGGIKLRQSELLKCKDLFSTIDVMPMRKSEIKTIKNKYLLRSILL